MPVCTWAVSEMVSADLVIAERVVSHEDSLSARPLTVHRVWIEGQPRWAAPAVRPLYGELPAERVVLEMRRADNGQLVRVLFDPELVTISRDEQAIRGANAIRRRAARVSGIDQNRLGRAGTGEFKGTRPETPLGRSQASAQPQTESVLTLDARAVAELMGLTPRNFRRFIRQMNIVPVRVGKNYRFTDADIAVLKTLYREWRPCSAA